MGKTLVILAMLLLVVWGVIYGLFSLYIHYMSASARERRRLEKQKLETDLSFYTLERKIEYLETERKREKTGTL